MSFVMSGSSRMFRAFFTFSKTGSTSRSATYDVVTPKNVTPQIHVDTLNVPLPPYAR
jgi:hypothetical protein